MPIPQSATTCYRLVVAWAQLYPNQQVDLAWLKRAMNASVRETKEAVRFLIAAGHIGPTAVKGAGPRHSSDKQESLL